MLSLGEGPIHIIVAEFLAALITCETFAEFCRGKMTTLAIDNISAKAWLDSARCPKHPYDRCAQSTHLYMLKQKMKIQTQWVSSEANILADKCSRKHYVKSRKGQIISGTRLKKIRPMWLNVLRFCK